MNVDSPDPNLSQPLVPPPPFSEFHFSLPSPMRELASHTYHDFGISPGSHSGLDAMDFQNQGIESAWDNSFRVSGGELGIQRTDSSVAPALLSLDEQNDLLGFLDRFDWEFEPALPQNLPSFPSKVPVSVMEHSNQLGLRTTTSPRAIISSEHTSEPDDIASSSRIRPRNPMKASESVKKRRTSSSAESTSPHQNDMNDMTPEKQTKKSLLSQPQKRLNHIMSEQRRRTAIKEGFVTIEKLIAVDPRFEGPLPTLPSSSDKDGSRRSSKGRSVRGKGKMGSLFRAVEFIGFLEENVQALRSEVERLEAASRQ